MGDPRVTLSRMGAEDEAAAAAAQNGASNGDTAASSTQSASVEAGQPGARKRSRWAASNDEGGGEGVGDTKKRKSKVLPETGQFIRPLRQVSGDL